MVCLHLFSSSVNGLDVALCYRFTPGDDMKVAVFCGSSLGSGIVFQEAAETLGVHFASQQIELVYGGGKVGLMGVIADAVLAGGGNVTGVIPQALKDREIAHPKLTQLYVVPDMHTRKAKMADLADAFVALPGGAGTLEEFFEVWTWAQLGYHTKACALYNVAGYFDKLLEFTEHMVEKQFLKREYADMIQVATNPKQLVDGLKAYKAPKQKWM